MATTPHPLSANGVVKTRRSHRKSRNGCSECKRRHIRCDERRPACSNCTIAERICSFPPLQQSKQIPQQLQPQSHHHSQHQLQSQPHSPAADSLSRHSHQSPSCEPESAAPSPWPVCAAEPTLPEPSCLPDRYRPGPGPVPPPLPQMLPSFTESFTNTPYHPPAPPATLFTAQHLMLLHHAATSSAMNCPIMAHGQTSIIVEVAIRHAIDAPYLIDQVLAISALHLAAKTKPGESHPAGTTASLRHQATELQTRAVSSYTRNTASIPADDTATCVPRFLFASVLSMQVLAETLHHPNDPRGGGTSTFHGFIERMVECMHLHRGLVSIIEPIWSYLMQSELQPLLRITQDANIAAISLSPGTECLPLEHLIRASSSPLPHGSTNTIPLDPASADACRGAISRLQWAFNMHNSLPDPNVPHAPSGFIVTLPAGYVDLLRTLRPEALIILAYLGVLLHRCRRFWTFGDAGAKMIRAIAGYLGGQWHEALAWPLKSIQTEND